MIVEPNLAPGDHARALLDKMYESLFGRLVKQLRIVRVHTDCGKYLFMIFGQRDRPLKGATVGIAGADVQHRRHSGSAGARHYFFTISVVFGTVDMAM